MSLRLALLSVSNKTGLIPFAQGLVDVGFTILSTGGTARTLKESGVSVTLVEEYTGSPEVMGGRVKTLHPAVHGGLLGRKGVDDEDMSRVYADYIDLVAVNLYPFEQTVSKLGVTLQDAIENIDIGGPSMLRSAAKNHERVTVVCDPADYEKVLEELQWGEVSDKLRLELAIKVFNRTSYYDSVIADYLCHCKVNP